MKLPDRDLEALAAAVMADIEGAETDSLRRLLWRARFEGMAAGAILAAVILLASWAVIYSPLILG